jgi:hypothetical protein
MASMSQNTNKVLRGLLDRPMNVSHIANFNKMVVELSPYMTEIEIDKCIDHMYILEHSIGDSNPSVSDCKTQLQLMLGSERFLDICKAWNAKNQKWLTVFGKLKYKCNTTGQYYDGLDPEDNADDYSKVYI